MRGPEIQPGDLVECISDDWLKVLPHGPKVGDILRVLRVQGMHQFGPLTIIQIGLQFKHGGMFYMAGAFRKAPRDTAPAEPSFTAWLKAELTPKPESA